MDKNTLFNELTDILEPEDSFDNEKSIIHLTSLSTLSIMAFIYENFEKQVKVSELQKLVTIEDLMNLIGKEKFSL
jgi:acyl carrier protein